MELYQLIQFKAIAESDSMNQAAERLNISQPALSMTLKKLEAEFNVRLFDREKKNLVLNDAGKLLLEHTALILGKVEDLQTAMARISQREETFSVGFAESTAMWFFQSKWIGEMNRHTLQCSIVMEKDRIVNGLLNGTYDAVVTTEPIETKGLICKHLIDDIKLLSVHFSSPLANRTTVSVRNDKISQMAIYKVDNHFYHEHMSYFNSLENGPEIISFTSLPLLAHFSHESSVPILSTMLSAPYHAELMDRKVLVLEDPELLMRYYIVYKRSERIKQLKDFFFKSADEAPDFLSI